MMVCRHLCHRTSQLGYLHFPLVVSLQAGKQHLPLSRLQTWKQHKHIPSSTHHHSSFCFNWTTEEIRWYGRLAKNAPASQFLLCHYIDGCSKFSFSIFNNCVGGVEQRTLIWSLTSNSSKKVREREYKPSTKDGMDLSLSELEKRISSLLMKSL